MLGGSVQFVWLPVPNWLAFSINIKPEHIDAWLNPDPVNLQGLYAIFDDRQHPYYEHRETA